MTLNKEGAKWNMENGARGNLPILSRQRRTDVVVVIKSQ